MKSAWNQLRPAMVPYVWGAVALGYGLGHWDGARPMGGLGSLLATLVAWLLLQAGTMWWNAATDRDEGPVLWGRPGTPPPVPLAVATLIAAVVVAFWASAAIGVTAALCAALAAAYSAERTRWKGHPWGGPVVNVVGYGLATPYAGFAASGAPLTPRVAILGAIFVSAVASLYLVAQAFQADEDRRRGDRTYVARYGALSTVLAARWCLDTAGVLALGMVLAGWLPRSLLLGLPFGLVLRSTLILGGTSPSPAWASAVAAAMLRTALVALAILSAQYVVDDLSGRPVAGLGTARGLPLFHGSSTYP